MSAPLPAATERYDRNDQDRLRGTVEQRLAALEQRPALEHINSDRGDNDVTLTAGVDVTVQAFATNLTANRTVTLGQGYSGAKFTVVRMTPGAANSIDIGPGLKTFVGTNQWADFGHNGSAWFLVRAGSL